MRDLELMTMASLDFFEPLSRMKVDPVYQRILDVHVPQHWHRKAFDVWLFAQPELGALVQQGFKIHVSATIRNAGVLLHRVLPYCVERQFPFKIVADPRLLSLMNSKNFDRGSSGKFIVIYPPTTEECRAALEHFYAVTADQQGPYVLSDRRYRDSRVLFYRFGGFWPMHRVEPDGSRTTCIETPDGRLEPDLRLPYFTLPPWIEDPFYVEDPAAKSESTGLLNNRYQVKAVLTFSNGGGVYEALDTFTGAKVVLKEARPLSNYWMADENDAAYLDAVKVLEREHRTLVKLAHLDFVVKPVELFQEWEHLFLAEEFLPGLMLTNFRARPDFIVITLYDGPERVDRFCEKFAVIARQLIRHVLTVHSCNVLLVDLSPNNFLIEPDTLTVRLIDLECAIDLDTPQTGDEIVRLWTTPGSRRPGWDDRQAYTREDDYYALGMVLYSLLMPMQTLFEMKPAAAGPYLDDIAQGVGLPPQVPATIRLLLEGKAVEALEVMESWDVEASLRQLRALGGASRAWEAWTGSDRQRIASLLRPLVRDMARFVLSTADPERSDRLFPGDFRVYGTNPLSVASGASGPLLFLHETGTDLPEPIEDWVLRQPFREDTYPPGLVWGLSGIACVLEQIGLGDKAAEALRLASESELRFAAPDFWYGAAGWGWAQLWFYRLKGDRQSLDNALAAGRFLRDSAEAAPVGRRWRNPLDGNIHYGLAYGASGIALFLAQLYRESGEEEFRQLALEALAFERSAAIDQDSIVKWFNHDKAEGICEPYFEHGSAGIAAAFLRCADLLGEPSLLAFAEEAAQYAFCKWTVLPSLFSGVSGIGELMIDLFLKTGDERYLNRAHTIAETIQIYALPKPEGTAFPGRMLIRLSTDLATGSAGIGLFLHRLLDPGPRHFLDLEAGQAARQREPRPAVLELQESAR